MKKFLSALLVLLAVAATADNTALNSEKSDKSANIKPVVKPVEPALFSPPVCVYAGLHTLIWGYHVNSDTVDPQKIPARISCSIPELKVNDSADVKVGEYRKEWIRVSNPMAPGKYKVIMKALGRNGKVLLEKSFTLVVINRPEYGKNFPIKSVAVDPEGNILVNGRKTLINGVYNAFHSNGAKNIAYAGFNAAKVTAENSDDCKRLLKTLEINNIYGSCELKYSGSKKTNSFVKAIKDHPALLFWNIAGKPEISSIQSGKFPQALLRIRADGQCQQTTAQIRSSAYIALVNGAKCLWWDDFHTAYRIPHIWDALLMLNSELFELEDVILGKRTMLAASSQAVRAAVFTDDKRTVVIAVNTSQAEAKTVLSGIPGKIMTELFADNASVSVDSNKAKFSLAPESTRIFEVK